MKFLILIPLLFSLFLSARDLLSGKIIYQAEIKLDKSSTLEPRSYKTVVYFTNEESVSEDFENTSANESETSFFIDLAKDMHFFVYKNYQTNEMISSEMLVDKLVRIQDTIPFMNWQLTREGKKVQDISCFKATGHFRGRDYIAWYAPDIPVNRGPWKFGGLPGLIVEISDVDDEVHFNLLGYSPGLTKKEKAKIHAPQSGNIMTFDKYYDLWNTKSRELVHFLSSELNSENVKIESNGISRIEKSKQ
jgi:GLPGLI family protein